MDKIFLINKLIDLIDSSDDLDLALEVRDFRDKQGIGATYTQDMIYLKEPDLEKRLTDTLSKIKRE